MRTLKRLILVKQASGGALSEYDVEGNPVSFSTNVAKPLSVLAAFSPVQSGSGDPSPDNVRPITGFTGANVYLSPTDSDDPAKQTFAVTFPALGKNLFDKNAVTDGKALDTSNGDVMITSASHCVTDYIPVKQGEPVYIPSTSTTRRWFYNTKKQAELYLGQAGNQIFTPQVDGYIRVTILKTEVNLDTYQIEYGSSATAYEPYTNTAYGGTLDLTTGVLTVGWQYITVTESDTLYSGTTYNGETGTDRYKAIPSTGLGTTSQVGFGDKMQLVRVGVWGKPDEHIWEYCINTRQLHMVFDNETVGITSVMTESERTAAIKSWLENNPLHFVAMLATPLVYQLTPTEILSLVGDNVLWSDLNGDLSVTYKKRG